MTYGEKKEPELPKRQFYLFTNAVQISSSYLIKIITQDK